MQSRVGDDAAQRDGVGVLRDCIVDEIQLAGLIIEPAVRQPDPDNDRLETAPRRIAIAQHQPLAHRNRERDIHRVLADDRGQHAGTRTDDVAVGYRGAADLAVDRRVDFGVVEIDLRQLHLRLRGLHLCFEALLVGDRGVIGGLLAGRTAEQSFGPVGGQLGVDQRCLQLRDLGLLRLQVGLERAALELDKADRRS